MSDEAEVVAGGRLEVTPDSRPRVASTAPPSSPSRGLRGAATTVDDLSHSGDILRLRSLVIDAGPRFSGHSVGQVALEAAA